MHSYTYTYTHTYTYTYTYTYIYIYTYIHIHTSTYIHARIYRRFVLSLTEVDTHFYTPYYYALYSIRILLWDCELGDAIFAHACPTSWPLSNTRVPVLSLKHGKSPSFSSKAKAFVCPARPCVPRAAPQTTTPMVASARITEPSQAACTPPRRPYSPERTAFQ